jgi:excisionase family DNA binding protein
MTERLAYSDKEAAHLLGLSVRSIVYLRQTGKLGFSRLGRRILIPATELQRVLKRSYVRATAIVDADESIRPVRKPQGVTPGALDECAVEKTAPTNGSRTYDNAPGQP